MNAMTEMEALANASIEEIEAMAISNGEAQAQPDADHAETTDADGGKQGVTEASPGQTEEQGHKANDKELNFAKLRTKAESLEREVQKLADENKRLAERQYVAELPEGHAERVKEVDSQLVSLGAKFTDGVIDWEEYQVQLQAAQQLREGLVAASLKAEISREMREQAEAEKQADMSKSWEDTVASFIQAKPDSVDYAADETRAKDLNTYVKALGADADNNDKPMEWFLQEAHALVKSKHRIATAPQAVEVKPQAPVSMPFHTLSEVPGGSVPARSESEHLKQMSGAALTNLFLKDPSKIDEYLASLE